MDLYKVKLANFEGPLDLLLFFVRKDELNIYDIPIARITKSYLEYLKLMQDMNLDVAAEFILMAATLMRIKVKMMLPVDPAAEEEEEMLDPREELSRRLIEYRQFKEASKSLSELDEYWRQVYRRSYFNFDLIPKNEEEVYGLKDISFFDLLTAYKKALEKKPIPVYHSVERLNVTVEQQQQFLMDFFGTRTCYLFSELCEHMVKVEVVVTFLAMLDLVKRGDIALRQASIFDDIWIYRGSEFPEETIPEEDRAFPTMAASEPIAETELPAMNTTVQSTNSVEVIESDEQHQSDEVVFSDQHQGLIGDDVWAVDVAHEAFGDRETIEETITDAAEEALPDEGVSVHSDLAKALQDQNDIELVGHKPVVPDIVPEEAIARETTVPEPETTQAFGSDIVEMPGIQPSAEEEIIDEAADGDHDNSMVKNVDFPSAAESSPILSEEERGSGVQPTGEAFQPVTEHDQSVDSGIGVQDQVEEASAPPGRVDRVDIKTETKSVRPFFLTLVIRKIVSMVKSLFSR